MTPRAKLQAAYELAFHPVQLNATWNEWEKGTIVDLAELRLLVDWALALHQRLPEAPAVTARALHRLARYQATSRLYRMPSVLRRFRERLGAVEPVVDEVPAWMVRDIALPPFQRDRFRSPVVQHVSSPFDPPTQRC
jgi:hypothetical protein